MVRVRARRRDRRAACGAHSDSRGRRQPRGRTTTRGSRRSRVFCFCRRARGFAAVAAAARFVARGSSSRSRLESRGRPCRRDRGAARESRPDLALRQRSVCHSRCRARGLLLAARAASPAAARESQNPIRITGDVGDCEERALEVIGAPNRETRVAAEWWYLYHTLGNNWTRGCTSPQSQMQRLVKESAKRKPGKVDIWPICPNEGNNDLDL